MESRTVISFKDQHKATLSDFDHEFKKIIQAKLQGELQGLLQGALHGAFQWVL